jgi:hypothetical protein
MAGAPSASMGVPASWAQAPVRQDWRPYQDPPRTLPKDLREYLYRKHRFDGVRVAGVEMDDPTSLAYIRSSGAGALPTVAAIEKKQLHHHQALREGWMTKVLTARSRELAEAEPPMPSDYAAARDAFNLWLKARLVEPPLRLDEGPRPLSADETALIRSLLNAERWRPALAEAYRLRAEGVDGPELAWALVMAHDGLGEPRLALEAAEAGRRQWPQDGRFRRRLEAGRER